MKDYQRKDYKQRILRQDHVKAMNKSVLMLEKAWKVPQKSCFQTAGNIDKVFTTALVNLQVFEVYQHYY